MTSLIIVVTALISISFLCSLFESIILSVNEPFIETLIEKKKRAGFILRKLKKKINEPLTAILTLNTISNTAGATIAGALAVSLFGSKWMGLFSAVLTFSILVFSEIIPKTLGATYWRTLSIPAAQLLHALVLILKPITTPINFIAHHIAGKKPINTVTKQEIVNAIRMGYLQGVIESSEFEMVNNFLKLKELRVKDVMTPRTVVVRLHPAQTTGSLRRETEFKQFSRIPLIGTESHTVQGIVLRKDIMANLADGKDHIPLSKMAQPPTFIPESVSLYDTLQKMIHRQAHLAVAIGEFGGYTGVITLEDIFEAMLGREIVDESDRVVDMRDWAKKRMKERFGEE